MKKITAFLALLLLLYISILPVTAQEQNLEQAKSIKADSLRQEYQFQAALQIYKELLRESNDSTLIQQVELRIIECENGENMLRYSTPLIPTGKRAIPKEDFFLYIPSFQQWSVIPDSISQESNSYLSSNIALLEPFEGKKLYYSAPNNSGDWDIFVIEQIDGNIWNNPQPIGEQINSSGNEIFPLVSQDGKRLYFASNGHFGMGGYDLYVCEWNESQKEWGSPQNLGFPYSTTANDLMIVNTPDGKYSYIVSDREHGLDSDSLTIYRVEFEPNPIKKKVESAHEAIELASLTPKNESEQKSIPKGKSVISSHNGDYTRALMESKAIERRVDSVATKIESERNNYAHTSTQQERTIIESRLLELEFQLIELNTLLQAANEIVQNKEVEFLSKGVLVPRAEESVQISPEPNPLQLHIAPLEIEKQTPFPFPELEFPPPPAEPVDYSITIEKVSTFAPEQELPKRLVYRIQLLVLSNPFKNIATFKGLTPLFVIEGSGGKQIYSVGQYSNYSEAATALQMVKRRGFPSAIITPFHDGKSLSIKVARELEEEIRANTSYQVKSESYPAGMPQSVVDLLKSRTDKDLVKKIVSDKSIYFIGPFKNEDEATQILELLNSLGGERNYIDIINLK